MADTTTNLAAASLTFSVLSFIMLAITLIFFLFPDFSATIRSGISRTSNVPGSGSSLKMLGAFLGALSPDITLLSGFVSDIINGSFRYSVTSIIGVISVIMHWAVGGLVHGFSSSSSPSTVASVASAVASVASSSAEQLLGTGSEPSNPTPPPAAGPSRTMRRAIRRVPGPGSVSTMSSLPTLAGPGSITGPGSRTAALNSRLGPVIPGARPSRSVQLRGGAEDDGQDGGGWEVPDDLRSTFNPCSIRGLGMFDISKSPMGMAALSSVFAVYLLDMSVNSKRSSKDILVYLAFSGVVYGLNLFSYTQFKCYGDSFGAVARSTILPIVLGLAVGSAGFATLKTTFPAYLPLDAQPIGDPALPSKHSRCAPPNDQDQFVCDAYKDGKRISTAVVE